MMDEGGLVYKKCREASGLSQERAAELLNVSVRQLARYEAGECVPAADIVDRMIQLYPNSGFLAISYIHAVAGLAGDIIPPVDKIGWQQATMRLYNATMRFADNHRDRQLMQIAEDGRIDESERTIFNQITAELDAIVQAALEYQCAAPELPDA